MRDASEGTRTDDSGGLLAPLLRALQVNGDTARRAMGSQFSMCRRARLRVRRLPQTVNRSRATERRGCGGCAKIEWC